jgi:hypothetical protein
VFEKKPVLEEQNVEPAEIDLDQTLVEPDILDILHTELHKTSRWGCEPSPPLPESLTWHRMILLSSLPPFPAAVPTISMPLNSLHTLTLLIAQRTHGLILPLLDYDGSPAIVWCFVADTNKDKSGPNTAWRFERGTECAAAV